MNTCMPRRQRTATFARPRRRLIALLAVAFVLVTTAVALPASGAQPPRQWTGTARYTETRQSGDEKQQVSISARITLGHVAKRGHTKWEYMAKSGSITWDASGSDQFCRWKSVGSRHANRYDLYPSIEGSGPYRAAFSGQDSMDVPAMQTCVVNNNGATQTSSITKSLTHPFFVLGRIAVGVPVDARLTTIRGHRAGSESTTGFTYRWTYSWAFRARR